MPQQFTANQLLYPSNDPNLYGPGGTISAGSDPNVSVERRKKKSFAPGDPLGFYQRQVLQGQEAADVTTPFQFITDTGQSDFGSIYSGLYNQPYVNPNINPNDPKTLLEQNFGKTSSVTADVLDPLLSGKEDYSYLLQPANPNLHTYDFFLSNFSINFKSSSFGSLVRAERIPFCNPFSFESLDESEYLLARKILCFSSSLFLSAIASSIISCTNWKESCFGHLLRAIRRVVLIAVSCNCAIFKVL